MGNDRLRSRVRPRRRKVHGQQADFRLQRCRKMQVLDFVNIPTKIRTRFEAAPRCTPQPATQLEYQARSHSGRGRREKISRRPSPVLSEKISVSVYCLMLNSAQRASFGGFPRLAALRLGAAARPGRARFASYSRDPLAPLHRPVLNSAPKRAIFFFYSVLDNGQLPENCLGLPLSPLSLPSAFGFESFFRQRALHSRAVSFDSSSDTPQSAYPHRQMEVAPIVRATAFTCSSALIEGTEKASRAVLSPAHRLRWHRVAPASCGWSMKPMLGAFLSSNLRDINHQLLGLTGPISRTRRGIAPQASGVLILISGF